MSFYIGREASKFWKRFCAETTTEINLLAENILGGLICQYVHGLAARGVHYFRRPGPIPQDAGFFLLPELWQNKVYISETVFIFIFLSFVLWTFHPFILKGKKIHTVLIWCRLLAFLVACQILLSLLSFLLNCLVQTIIVVRHDSRGLIASPSVSFLSCDIFLGIFVAWYTVNLVVFFLDKKLPELLDRSKGGTSLLLPLTKDKEETHKLLYRNFGDAADWGESFLARTSAATIWEDLKE